MIHRFRKVAKDLYRGSAPTPVDVVTLKNKLGINKIVSLDERTGKIIDNTAKALGINHIMLPISDRLSLINFLNHDLKKLFLEGGPTFVHCAHGKDRTGLACALVKCKYFGEDPERAIAEAKSLGFGIGIDPHFVDLYEKIIRECKLSKDSNNADIVSIEREYIDDNRGSVLDSGSQSSFAPHLDQTKVSPTDFVYLSDLEQSPTRDNRAIKEHSTKEEDVVPVVGLENNDTGGRGFGPVENAGRFFYD